MVPKKTNVIIAAATTPPLLKVIIPLKVIAPKIKRFRIFKNSDGDFKIKRTTRQKNT